VTSAHGAAHDSGVQWWPTDAVSVLGCVVLVALAAAFVFAARRKSRSGRVWPSYRVWSYVSGCGLIALVLFSGVSRYDRVFGVHVSQHLVLMMVVPPLLVRGGPLRLCLRTLPQLFRAEVTAILSDPVVRRVTAGQRTAILLCLDYYGSMAVYLLTPLYQWGTEHEWLHISAHVYFLLCGIMFWIPLVGEDPIGWRTDWPVKRAMLLIGVPFYLALGGLVAVLPGPSSMAGSGAAGAILALGGSALSLAAVGALRARGTHISPGERRPSFADLPEGAL
jgi:cytochrome c oxidase assembly factor CtaG